MNKKIGEQTVKLGEPVTVAVTASIVGKKEGEGPLGKFFDKIINEATYGEDSWEKAESKFARETISLALAKANMSPKDIDYIFMGDLLNQCCGSTFGVKDFGIPFFGVFGACSTFGESMSLGAMLIDGGFATTVICGAGSHFCTAEKQFRLPLEQGTQRTPTSTWTVTGEGVAILTKASKTTNKNPYGSKITHLTTGKIVDLGVKDAGNMGAAMAPAAAQVIAAHFRDTNRSTNYYDVIATGDLGYVGRALLRKLLADEGFIMGDNLTDCGIEIYNKDQQDTHCGGSGCGCSAVTYCGYFDTLLNHGTIKKMLLVPTGALMSSTSSQQGQSIPSIAHAIAIEKE